MNTYPGSPVRDVRAGRSRSLERRRGGGGNCGFARGKYGRADREAGSSMIGEVGILRRPFSHPWLRMLPCCRFALAVLTYGPYLSVTRGELSHGGYIATVVPSVRRPQ